MTDTMNAEYQRHEAFKKEAMLVYLDNLREGGTTNVFGASIYLMDAFDLGRTEANKIVAEWMRTYSERHPK